MNTKIIWTIFTKTLKNTVQIKRHKMLIVFDDMIAGRLRNKKLNPILTEFFITGRKLNISLVFITRSYCAVSKSFRTNSTRYFIIKIPNKWELYIPFFLNTCIFLSSFLTYWQTTFMSCYIMFISFLWKDEVMKPSRRKMTRNVDFGNFFHQNSRYKVWPIV